MEAEVLTETSRNETLNTIYTRRAVRKYKNIPVEKRLIEQLLDAGRMAPSALNKQPWKFYVVTNKDVIHTLSTDISKKAFKETIKKGVRGFVKAISGLSHFLQSFKFSSFSDPVFYNAPVVIFITSAKDNPWAQLDIGMCAQNIMLAARTLGLATCPVGYGKFVDHTQHYDLLNIPDSEIVQLSVIVGYGDERPAPHKRVTDNVVYIG